jgi:hypothetical protein
VEDPASYYTRVPWDSDGIGGLVDGEDFIGSGGRWTKVSQRWTRVRSYLQIEIICNDLVIVHSVQTGVVKGDVQTMFTDLPNRPYK